MRLIASTLVCIALLGPGVCLAVPPAAPTSAAAVPAPTTAEVKPEAAHTGEAKGEVKHGEAEAPVDPVQEELHLGTFIATITIFLVLFAILYKAALKPIQSGLQNRENAIRDSIEAAKRAKDEAERTTRELEAKMAEVQRQAAQQLTQAKTDAQKVADTIRAQAEAESAALKDRTLREIDAAKQQAVAEINSHAAELGTAVARKILQRNVTVDDQQRLVDESLAEMAKTN